jgi:hypothetical protein
MLQEHLKVDEVLAAQQLERHYDHHQTERGVRIERIRCCNTALWEHNFP